MPRPISDPRDYSSRYNTKLTPEQEQTFTNWMWNNSQKIGRSLWPDLYNYDLRGYFLQGGQIAGGHLPDTFKKPNHPTFSDQSMYSGIDSYVGGRWQRSPNGQWMFFRGPSSLYSIPELQAYFARVEPKSILVTQ